MEIKDGGPAFPRVGEGFGNPKYDAAGMGMWMPHVAQFDENDHPINRSMKEMEDVQRQARANWAYAEEDAMIKAREVTP
jgi:hypothetical protein